MLNSRTTKIRFSLAAALAATLGACDDVAPPKPHASIVAEPPRPEALPSPPPVTTEMVKTTPPVTATKPEPSDGKKPTAEDDSERDRDDVKARDPIGAARKLLEAGKLDGALRFANLGVRRTPSRSVAWNVLGRVQLQMGKREEAIASFGKAVELNPRSSYAQNNLGLALLYAKRFGDAVDALEQAVELEPVEAYMWNNLGMAYEQLNRLEEARDAYDKAASMESERARDSLARLEGVKTVFRTARVETTLPPSSPKEPDSEHGDEPAPSSSATVGGTDRTTGPQSSN
jgi:tetratricopeptide (TPR) repeat protein